MTRILAVSAGLSVPSSTRLLTERLADAVRADLGPDAEVELVELRPLAHALADHLLTGFPNAELEEVLEKVRLADGLIMVTPVFSASFSGLFKTFVDVMEPGLLIGKPVLIGATAGTSRHSLVLDHALRPLFAYLRAVVVPTGVFAATEDFGDHGLEQRVERAAGELASLVGGRRALHVVRDEFADPTPFADRLRGLST
ncbi:FMN reductase [Nocardioides sp. 503]|uniref:FMN reductase n=1 Tax=Nocardioides sp. 503 TaxID=2508326 RepID=UPI00106F7CFF|nr:FMN reductase [Nocardioides sp. 503]